MNKIITVDLNNIKPKTEKIATQSNNHSILQYYYYHKLVIYQNHHPDKPQ
jgi:hypothetical protein